MLIEGEIYYQGDSLFCEQVPLTRIAETYGTPAYVYSRKGILSRFAAYQTAMHDLPHQICYAVKANSNLSLLRMLADAGAGFDIVSGGELYRVLEAGARPGLVVFSGVGKTGDEILFALRSGIGSFNCESETEIHTISSLAANEGVTANIAIRVNPDVNAATHPYISTGLKEHKFGIDINEAEALYSRIAHLPGIRAEGVSCHIGSQLLELTPLVEAADKVIALARRLRANGIGIRTVDLGGGIGVPYRTGDQPFTVADFINKVRPKLAGLDFTITVEPGRSIVAESGLLLTRTILTKTNGQKTFVVVDAGMNDLLRPSLYSAHHEIIPVRKPNDQEKAEVDVVGPVCESGDFLARNRPMPHVDPGDLLAIQTAGAYGFVLASNYNSRPRPCELIVDGTNIHVARRRESYSDLLLAER